MLRKLAFALILAGATLMATEASSSDPTQIDNSCLTGSVKPCDVICGENTPPETVCECPCWTDRRVEQSTCEQWYSITGCWWF